MYWCIITPAGMAGKQLPGIGKGTSINPFIMPAGMAGKPCPPGMGKGRSITRSPPMLCVLVLSWCDVRGTSSKFCIVEQGSVSEAFSTKGLALRRRARPRNTANRRRGKGSSAVQPLWLRQRSLPSSQFLSPPICSLQLFNKNVFFSSKNLSPLYKFFVLVCSRSSHRHSYIPLIFGSRFIDS